MLAGSGAEKIGCIGVTKRDRAVGEARKKGFLDAMEEAGIDWKEAYYEECGFSAQDGYEAAERLFAREPELTECFAPRIPSPLARWHASVRRAETCRNRSLLPGLGTLLPKAGDSQALQRSFLL